MFVYWTSLCVRAQTTLPTSKTMAGAYGHNIGIPDGSGFVPGGWGTAPGGIDGAAGGPALGGASNDVVSWAQGNGAETRVQQSLADAPSATHVQQFRTPGDRLRITMTAKVLNLLGDFGRILTMRRFEKAAYTYTIKVVPQSTMSSIAAFGNAPYVQQQQERHSVVLSSWGHQALLDASVHVYTPEGAEIVNDSVAQLRDDAAATLVLQGFNAILTSPGHAGVYNTNRGRSLTPHQAREDRESAVWTFAAANKQEHAIDMMITTAGRVMGTYGSDAKALVSCMGLHAFLRMTPGSLKYSEAGPDKTPNGFLSLLNTRKTLSGLSLHESMNINIGDRETQDPMCREVSVGEHAAVATSRGCHTVTLVDDSMGRAGDVSIGTALDATHLFDAAGQLKTRILSDWLSKLPQGGADAHRFTPLVGRIHIAGRPVATVPACFIGGIDEEYLTTHRVAAAISSFEGALRAGGAAAYDSNVADLKEFIALFDSASIDAFCHTANIAWAAEAQGPNADRLRDTYGMPDLDAAIEFVLFRFAFGAPLPGAPAGTAAFTLAADNPDAGELTRTIAAIPAANASIASAANIATSRLAGHLDTLKSYGNRPEFHAWGNLAGPAVGAAVFADEFGAKPDMKRVGQAPGGYCTFAGMEYLASLNEDSSAYWVYRPAVLAAKKALPAFRGILRQLKRVMPHSVLYQKVAGSPFNQFASEEASSAQTAFHVLAGSQSPVFVALTQGAAAGGHGAVGANLSVAELGGLGAQQYIERQSPGVPKQLRNAALKELLGNAGELYRNAREALKKIHG